MAQAEALLARESSADTRAREVEQQMTDDERLSLIVSMMGASASLGIPRDPRIPQGVSMSAGYTPGVPRLGIPALQSTGAGMGVASAGYHPDDRGATAFPASILIGATFSRRLPYEIGSAIGREARSRGFNVVLAGGINLVRDVRNGSNFERYSEDPWHSAILGSATVSGIQAEGVISTLRHYSLACNETQGRWLDALIDPDAHRESDLLAFQIAIERSQPGAIMSGCNKVNGQHASGDHLLLQEVLKERWGYKGYVMSDWGAVPEWEYALAGLDQESGIQMDLRQWGSVAFAERLKAACAEGKLPRQRLSDMARRILRSLFAVGADRWGSPPQVDMAQHNRIALRAARHGIVLLKNQGVLPLARDRQLKIAVIGGHAQEGVVSGAGSSAVMPVGGFAAVVKIGGPGVMGSARNLLLLPPSPLAELQKLLPTAQLEFDPGYTPAEAMLLARRSDVVIAFGIRAEAEGFDSADLSLPWGQDAVIDAVASVNPSTIVVLQTGNPCSMPWGAKVKAIVQAWYPGQAGAQAIAEILTGKVNPCGHLPITFPAELSQTPRPQLPGLGTAAGTPVSIRYEEGAEVGYRWYAMHHARPMYAFGHGLSYTSFAYSSLQVVGGEMLIAMFTITNTGRRAGADVPQVYLTNTPRERRMRLLAFERVELEPGESRRIEVIADPRLLARFDGEKQQWRIDEGPHTVALGRAADALVEQQTVRLRGRTFGH